MTSPSPVLWALLPPAVIVLDTKALRPLAKLPQCVLFWRVTECLTWSVLWLQMFMGTFGLRSWLPLVVGERVKKKCSPFWNPILRGISTVLAAVGKWGWRVGLGTLLTFSHMLVEFNSQKLVYICIQSQTLKLGPFFPFKKCKVKERKKKEG